MNPLSKKTSLKLPAQAPLSPAPKVVFCHISEEEADQRLDNYLMRVLKGVPKTHLYRIIRGGEVRVNGGRAEASHRLQAGDTVRIPPVRVASQTEKPPLLKAAKITLPILFEDESLLVIDKPSGIAVHGGSGLSFGVIEALRAQRPEARFLELAHRLDRETSGILLIAKRRAALKKLHDMFRGQDPDFRAYKRYKLLVKGVFSKKHLTVKIPLLKFLLPSGERRVKVSEEGKMSHTVFRVITQYQDFALLEADLKTGRTHQLRVHAAHLGHPILGDDKYGDFALNKNLEKEGLKRLFLHAAHIDFPHPVTKELCSFDSPLPADLIHFLARQRA